MIAGHIQLMFSDLAPAYPLIQAGKVRALGVTTAQRAPAAPELPPLAEVGVPGFDWAAWQSVAVPGGTPKDIIAKLNGAVNAAIAEPEVTKQLVAPAIHSRRQGLARGARRASCSRRPRAGRKVLQQAGVAGIGVGLRTSSLGRAAVPAKAGTHRATHCGLWNRSPLPGMTCSYSARVLGMRGGAIAWPLLPLHHPLGDRRPFLDLAGHESA